MSQYIKPRFRNETGWQLLQQVTVQNCDIRPQPLIHQRVFDSVVGQNGKIRNLRSGA